MELNVEENQLKLTKYLYLKSKCVHFPYEKKTEYKRNCSERYLQIIFV